MADMILSSAVPKYKLVFLGDIYVGKTSIINQFMYETFDNNYQATIGIDFLSKTIQLGDAPMRLQLWDTAGQERFRSLIPNYIRDSSAAIIVFDLTNSASFSSLDKWVEDVRNERGSDAVIVIIGNKVDKTDERAVTKENASSKAAQFSAIYAETSAKTGMNIKELFRDIAKALTKENTPVTEEKRGVGLILPTTLTQNKEKQVKRCC